VGDSHLFLFRAGELFHLNENHSLAPVLDKLVEDGEMSREQALAHPRRHYLRSALTGEEIELVDLAPAAIELEAGDCVILASDGIDTLDADEIADIVASRAGEDAEAIVAALIDAVLAARQTYQDNTTVMVVRVVG
jgi:protein phosphatase